MPDRLRFTIPGPPVAWQRSGVNGRGSGPRFFQPKETRSYQSLVRMAYAAAADGMGNLIDGPVDLEVTVELRIPPSWSKRKQARALDGTLWPTTRPDLDNIVKTIKDGLNGVAWNDDSQVCREHSRKVYGAVPKVTVAITRLPACG